MSYSIMRVKKHRSGRSVSGMGNHANRTRNTPNADPERRHLNETWMPQTGWVPWSRQAPRNLGQQLRDRLADFEGRGGRLRRDSVLTIELMLSASPDWFSSASREQRREWLRRNVAWIAGTFGESNVLQVTLHRDETTPHLHAFVVPEIQMVETRGRKPRDGSPASARAPKPALAASHWLDGRAKLGELQDRYAAAMEPLGLKRGLRGSGATHRSIRSYYAAAEAAMTQRLDETSLPAPPDLPAPQGWAGWQRWLGLVPRRSAAEIVKQAAQEAATQAASQARAAAQEAATQRRQLEDRLRGVGGIEQIEALAALVEALDNEALRALIAADLDRIEQALLRMRDSARTNLVYTERFVRASRESLAELTREQLVQRVPLTRAKLAEAEPAAMAGDQWRREQVVEALKKARRMYATAAAQAESAPVAPEIRERAAADCRASEWEVAALDPAGTNYEAAQAVLQDAMRVCAGMRDSLLEAQGELESGHSRPRPAPGGPGL
jgi:hypothetical protein